MSPRSLARIARSLSVALVAASTPLALAAQDAPKQDKPEQGKQAKELPPFEIDYGKRPAPKDCKISKWGPDSYESPKYAVRCRKILPVTKEPIENGVVLIENGKITAVGKSDEVEVPEGFTVVDCGDGWLVPGFIDLHCHVAGDGFDLNDMVHPTNPEFRTLDLVGLHHDQIKEALQGGVTSVLYIPGSGTNMGGFGTLTKTAGRSVEEALIRFPGSLKIAQAGNPERGAGDMGTGRIGMNFGLRSTLMRGKAYTDAWTAFEAGKGPKPKFDPALHYLRGLFLHEFPVSVHTQFYQVCLETLRLLHDELGLWVFVDHGTFDAFRMCGEARKRGVPVCNGPRQFYVDRETGAIVGNAAAWALGGQHGWLEPVPGVGRDGISINTDSPVVPQEELTVQAAMAVRLGLPWEWALRGLTINAARFVGAEHKIGSIEVGKDADFVLWTGDPIDPRHSVRKVWVSGSIYYDRDPGGKNEGKRRI